MERDNLFGIDQDMVCKSGFFKMVISWLNFILKFSLTFFLSLWISFPDLYALISVCE